MEMNKKDIDQLAAFITEDPREFHTESSDWGDGPGFGFSKEQLDSVTQEPDGVTQEPTRHKHGRSHSDIKVNAQEREAQKRELADVIRQGEEAQQFLSYIESVEHMSRSSLEY